MAMYSKTFSATAVHVARPLTVSEMDTVKAENMLLDSMFWLDVPADTPVPRPAACWIGRGMCVRWHGVGWKRVEGVLP